MPFDRETDAPVFNVIDGGARRALPVPEPDTPDFCASELAAEMAEIFAISLLRDCPLSDLSDPHHGVWVDGATRFTLHELLCELRNLSWFDAGEDPATAATTAFSRACPEGKGHRRSLHWNDDGQLTLRTLFRSGVALNDHSSALSELWAFDLPGAAPRGEVVQPGCGATLRDWLRWVTDHSGACLNLPGHIAPRDPDVTLGEFALGVTTGPAARPFYNAALEAFAQGIGFDPGLPEQDTWPGTWLLSLMAEAEGRARRTALDRMARRDRLSRPAVTAARMSVHLCSAEVHEAPDADVLRAACDELSACAPNLLYWVTRANRAKRGPQRVPISLFLPIQGMDEMPAHPSDLATHGVVAGALGTLIKAVFDSQSPRHGHMVDLSKPSLALAEETDRLCSNIAFARVAAGGHFPAENHQDLRIGEAIALQMLRTSLEAENRSASLTLRNFDGVLIRLDAHPRSFGHGHVQLFEDGKPAVWPQDEDRAAHLTAVV